MSKTRLSCDGLHLFLLHMQSNGVGRMPALRLLHSQLPQFCRHLLGDLQILVQNVGLMRPKVELLHLQRDCCGVQGKVVP